MAIKLYNETDIINICNIIKSQMSLSNDFTFNNLLNIANRYLEESEKLYQGFLGQEQKNLDLSLFNITDLTGRQFTNILGLETVILPNSLKTIGTIKGETLGGISVFNCCKTLSNIIFPEGLLSIGFACFSDCSNLKKISFPNTLERIGPYCFQHNVFTTVEFPNNLKSLEMMSFHSSETLSIVTFKGKPNNIESSVFQDCNNLKTINVPWAEGEVANAPWGATNATINYNYTGEQ